MKNFRVKCVKSYTPWWTEGKIYEVKNGKITDDEGEVRGQYFEKIEDFNRWKNVKFVLVGDEYVKGNKPTKEQLQEFDLVKLNDGTLRLIVCKNELTLITINNGSIWEYDNLWLDNYEDDLRSYNPDFDIVAYKHFNNSYSAIFNFVNDIEPDWDWIRKERKEMTLEEIEQALGYPVKIVD